MVASVGPGFKIFGICPSKSFRVRCPVQKPGPHEIAECFDGSRAEVVAVPVAPYVGISEDVHG